MDTIAVSERGGEGISGWENYMVEIWTPANIEHAWGTSSGTNEMTEGEFLPCGQEPDLRTHWKPPSEDWLSFSTLWASSENGLQNEEIRAGNWVTMLLHNLVIDQERIIVVVVWMEEWWKKGNLRRINVA